VSLLPSPGVLADALVVLHLAYVLFVVLGLVAVVVGGIRGWRWVKDRRFRWAHLVCTAIVAVEALVGVTCPLTTWESSLRRAEGQGYEDISFVGRLARDLLFVEASETTLTSCYVAFAALVIGAWFAVRPRRRARSVDRAGSEGEDTALG